MNLSIFFILDANAIYEYPRRAFCEYLVVVSALGGLRCGHFHKFVEGRGHSVGVPAAGRG